MNAHAVTNIPLPMGDLTDNRINILLLTNSKEVVYVTEPEKNPWQLYYRISTICYHVPLIHNFFYN